MVVVALAGAGLVALKTARSGLAAVLLVALLGAWALASSGGPGDAFERFWLDWQLRWSAAQQPPEGVLVYDIDDHALSQLTPRLGPWPYRRDVYAQVIDALRRAGARAIALDLLLIDRGPGDEVLARELAAAGAPVLLAAATTGEPQLPSAGNPRSSVRWPQMLLPHAGLVARHSAQIGVVSSPLDRDGQLRRLWLRHESAQGEWPAFPRALLGATHPQLRALPAQMALHLPGLPTSEAPDQPFAELVLAALDGDETAPALRAARGQVVFIGSSALATDRIQTPTGQWRGTTVLAQAYASLRDGQWLRPFSGSLAMLGLALLPSLWALARGKTQPRLAIGLALGLALALIGLSWALARVQLSYDPSPALGALALGLLGQLMLHGRSIQQQTQHLAHERAVAAAASAAKSRFLAHVSREIRAPLDDILAQTQGLAQAALGPDERPLVDQLAASGQQLSALIDQMLDLSALEAGQLRIHSAPLCLPELLQQAVAQAQVVAKTKNLNCTLIAPSDLPRWVLGDRRRLAQVLDNLLGNAMKFTPQGLVVLQVRADAEERISFAVVDTGVGIDPCQQARVFDPFESAGLGDTPTGSVGLGLAIARELVRLMGGEISLHSLPGTGSRFAFTLRLPSTRAPHGDDAHGAHPSLGEGEGAPRAQRPA